MHVSGLCMQDFKYQLSQHAPYFKDVNFVATASLVWRFSDIQKVLVPLKNIYTIVLWDGEWWWGLLSPLGVFKRSINWFDNDHGTHTHTHKSGDTLGFLHPIKHHFWRVCVVMLNYKQHLLTDISMRIKVVFLSECKSANSHWEKNK